MRPPQQPQQPRARARRGFWANVRHWLAFGVTFAGWWWFAKVSTGADLSGDADDATRAAARVCAQHGMVVRELVQARHTVQASGVSCAVPGQWDDLHTYPLAVHDLAAGLGDVFFVPVTVAFGGACAGAFLLAWAVAGRALGGTVRRARGGGADHPRPGATRQG
ncbi:hypothetical protein [Kitasatospora nipponensis]